MTERRRLLAGGAAAVLLSIVGVHRIGLGELRSVEAGYVSARRASACAIAGLDRFSTVIDPEALDEAVTEAIRDASRRLRDVERSLDEGWTFPYPGVRSARGAVLAAVEAQERLYAALLDDPQNTDDELEALRARNRRAERALFSARRWMFVAEGADWAQRGRC